MIPTLVVLLDLAREATRPLMVWAARWIDARQLWADSVLCAEARRGARRVGAAPRSSWR